jgi:DNA-binding response OmpR family regulator
LILRVRAILRRTHTQPKAAAPAPEEPVASPLPSSVNSILEQINSDTRLITSDYCLIVGEYVLDTRSYELHTPNHSKLRLTPVQYDLLYHLMSHPGQIFSPARLLDEVWDYPSDTGSPDLVRVHIKNLRERIEKDPSAPRFIRTVPGYGYTVSAEED